MSDRSRSRLFGRPSELLVDEHAPRISMPAPPARARLENEGTDPASPELTEEDSVPSAGPLQVFVGGSGRIPPRSAAPAPDAAPGSLMTDAMDQLGDAFGRRAPAPALPRASTDRPGEGGVRVALRVGAPRPPAAQGAPVAVQQRGQGIATAAARARVAKVEAPPPLATFDDDEHPNVGLSPFEVFEAPRRAGERSDPLAPEWDDPRFRKSDPAGAATQVGPLLVEARVPARSPTFDEPTRETTLPGVASAPLTALTETSAPFMALMEASAPPAPVGAIPAPAVPRPVTAPVREARPQPLHPRSIRPRLVAAAVVFFIVLGGVYAWRWQRKHPGAFARRPAAVAPPAVVLAAPPPAAPIEGSAAAVAPEAPPVSDVPLVVPEAVPAVAPTDAPTPPVAGVAVPPAAPDPSPVGARPVSAPAAPVAPVAAVSSEERRGAFELATGVLHVVCNRKATVYVDNVKVGTTADARPFEVVAGSHRVRVVGSNGRSHTQNVRIDAGRPSMLQFELR